MHGHCQRYHSIKIVMYGILDFHYFTLNILKVILGILIMIYDEFTVLFFFLPW